MLGSGHVTGGTTLFGHLICVRGDPPRAMLELRDDRSLTFLVTESLVRKRVSEDGIGHRFLTFLITESLARDLVSEDRVGNNVGIEGVAIWRIGDWDLVDFRPTRVTEYLPHKTSLTEAFRALAEASGGRWDEIDPVQFVRELRGEE